jgi:hypothetical protein
MDSKTTNVNSLKSKNQKIWILSGVLVLIVIIALIAAMNSNKSGSNSSSVGQTVQTGNTPTPGTTTANIVTKVSTPGLAPAPIATDTNLTAAEVSTLQTAKVVVAGANPIAADNKVLTPQGLPTDSAARSVDVAAPKQTGFLDQKTLPKTLAQVTIANGQFTPNTLMTTVNAPVSFSLTSGDNSVHVLNFSDPALSAIVILVGPSQTKAITFNAPAKAGSYTFVDATPGSTAKGTLIVK